VRARALPALQAPCASPQAALVLSRRPPVLRAPLLGLRAPRRCLAVWAWWRASSSAPSRICIATQRPETPAALASRRPQEFKPDCHLVKLGTMGARQKRLPLR
jgi:hypothetical protein